MARWYETFLTTCVAAKQRGLSLICHPDHKQAMMDMLERVAEDQLYKYPEPPAIVFYTGMPRGEVKLIDEQTKKTLTFQEAMKSGRGVGRIKQLLTPDESIRRQN